jgi:L,D-transpeptidase YcbB
LANGFLLVLSLLLCAPRFTAVAAAQPLSNQVSELLRQQLEPWKTPPPQPAPAPEPLNAPLQQPEVWHTLPPAVGSAPAPDFVGPPAPLSPNGDLTGSIFDIPRVAPPVVPTKSPLVNPSRVLPKLTAGKEVVRATAMLLRFYEGRDYRPAWSDDAGLLSGTDALLSTLRTEVEREGLSPEDYRFAQLTALVQSVRGQLGSVGTPLDPRALADLDLLLTDTFLTYGARVSVGKTKLDRLDASWFAKRQKDDLVQLLETAVDTNRVADILKTLPPEHPEYAQLREALARYRDLAARGGWPLVPAGEKLQSGDRNERVVALRARLRVTGELEVKPRTENSRRGTPAKNKKVPDSNVEEKELFDATVAQAVRRFQRRHGLNADGVLGDGTVAALNVTAGDRVQQIVANMERWRALPPDLGPRHIEVNIPDFSLDVVENRQPVLTMKVVVGKMMERRNTPTFSAEMTYVVLNPYWYVPKSIAEEELLPLSRKDPQYLAKHNFTVHRVQVADKPNADPNAVDGATTSAKTYRYLLRQNPGPTNSLGQIKFMLPNAYGVYLHDTPSKQLFYKTVRTFSHGCIRIEKPVDLAEYVLRGRFPEWSREAILSAIERQKQQTIWLPQPIPVYIQYWTAWVEPDGTVQFRNDIYGYDQVPGARLPISAPKPAPVKTARELQPAVQSVPSQEAQPDHPPLPQTRPIL